jgi:hypothetical protein
MFRDVQPLLKAVCFAFAPWDEGHGPISFAADAECEQDEGKLAQR